MPHRANGPVVMFLICLLGLFVGGRPATAEVTRIDVTSKQPYGTFHAGEYVIWQGNIHGDLSPKEAIPGIDKAARNAGRQRCIGGGRTQPRSRVRRGALQLVAGMTRMIFAE